jgi:hypothetical protein
MNLFAKEYVFFLFRSAWQIGGGYAGKTICFGKHFFLSLCCAYNEAKGEPPWKKSH